MPVVNSQSFPDTPEGYAAANAFARQSGGILKEGSGASLYQYIQNLHSDQVREGRFLGPNSKEKRAALEQPDPDAVLQQVQYAAFEDELAKVAGAGKWLGTNGMSRLKSLLTTAKGSRFPGALKAPPRVAPRRPADMGKGSARWTPARM